MPIVSKVAKDGDAKSKSPELKGHWSDELCAQLEVATINPLPGPTSGAGVVLRG
jgi:hypothetical protein